MSWKEEGRKLVEGRWIRFTAAQPSRETTFLGEPTKVTKTVQQGERKGEKYVQMSFLVRVDGEEKVLEPNRSLLTQLMDEDDIEPIVGRTLLIKCLDLVAFRNWSIRPIGRQSDVERSWAGDSKEQFKEKVAEHVATEKKKRTRKSKIVLEEVTDGQANEGENEVDGEPEN